MSLNSRLGKLEIIWQARRDDEERVRTLYYKVLIGAEFRIYWRAAAHLKRLLGDDRWSTFLQEAMDCDLLYLSYVFEALELLMEEGEEPFELMSYVSELWEPRFVTQDEDVYCRWLSHVFNQSRHGEPFDIRTFDAPRRATREEAVWRVLGRVGVDRSAELEEVVFQLVRIFNDTPNDPLEHMFFSQAFGNAGQLDFCEKELRYLEEKGAVITDARK